MADAAVSVDAEGKLHVTAREAIPDPPSVVELHRMLDAMLPRVGVPEAILEVMSWLPAPQYDTAARAVGVAALPAATAVAIVSIIASSSCVRLALR